MTDPVDPHRDLAGVLHDVSNALTVLLGWVGEARAPGAAPEAVAYALTIVEQRARIARDLARHAIGSARIDEQRDLSAITTEVTQALQVEAQRCGSSLVLSGAEVSARVAGALDVSQVLTNVVLNAFAYAPKGSVVSVLVSSDEETASLLVKDEGPGVDEARRESIFQGDSQRPGGTGVGLRHSRELARVWGGDVELLTPETGAKGATFRITWPRVDAIPRPPMSASRVADLSGLRVLVVEDDLAVTQLLEAAMEARGADVAIATNRAELSASLAALADSAAFDAVLVDLSPIAQDPASAFAEIRTRCPAAAMLLVTGNADRLPESIAAESFELVRKPFEVREVLAVLTNRASRNKRA